MDELATIYSMTGYAVVARELPQGSLNLELRSVNNRYLDIQFRLPDEFRLLEAYSNACGSCWPGVNFWLPG